MRSLVTVFSLFLGVAFVGATTRDVLTRNDIWRDIFARPSGAPADHGDASYADRVKLGRDLFGDVRLSGDATTACSSCHDPVHGFTDGRPTGAGPNGSRLHRNVPALYNLAWSKSYFWDGRAASLEEQARFPMLAADEMASDFVLVSSRLASDAAMTERFARAFPASPAISETTILAAIADYERSLVAPETRFDRWVQGDTSALSDAELLGFDLFVGKGGCVGCHGGWRFTDDSFHDIGLGGSDPGRGAVPGGIPGLAQFKTPGLRELTRTAPYMHDGSLATLNDVVDHYTGPLVRRPSVDAIVVRDLKLSAEEKDAMVAFLKALSTATVSPQRD